MKKMIQLVMGFIMLSYSAIGLAELKAGVLDVNLVLASLPQVKEMQANIKEKYDPRGKELVGLQNKFNDDLAKYRQDNAKLKGEELKKAQQNLIDQNKKIQTTRAALQRDLVTAQNDGLRPILQQIEVAIKKIADTQKFDLVVTRAGVAYVSPQFDLTNQVIAEMVKLAPKKQVVTLEAIKAAAVKSAVVQPVAAEPKAEAPKTEAQKAKAPKSETLKD